jgi:SAM-dependent methyltransferase
MLDFPARMRVHRVRVYSLPVWLDFQRLLGPFAWQTSFAADGAALCAEAELSRTDAADVEARLRGVGIGGCEPTVEIDPPLPRAAVRQARLAEARRYRRGTPGFARAGTRLDAEARRSLTPEALALELAQRAAGAHVLDVTCGAGGNAIAFARAGCRVTAVELDRARLAMARWNARVYGVEDQIQFIEGDARHVAASAGADLLFIDPPWGGRYDKRRVTLAELPLLEELLPLRSRFARVWGKVPPSFDVRAVSARPRAVFGAGEGDARRVKFLLLEIE